MNGKILLITLAMCIGAISAHGGHNFGYKYVIKHDHHGHQSGHHGGWGDHNSGLNSGHHHFDHHHEPNYKYEYGVKDSHTGDHKSAWESRHGDLVKGGYKLKESDGTTRLVEYTAGHHGFNAHVKKIGHAHHPAVYGNHHGSGYGGNWNDGHNHHHHGATSYSYSTQHHH